MAVYGNMVITQQGQTLYGKVQTGTTLTFTRMQIGSGQLANGQDPTTLTALITPIDYVTINSLSSSGGTANIRGIYQNTNLAASTYTCEIGLFAQDPDAGEILYAYANAGTNGDTIPPYADGPYSRQFQINTAVGNATSVTANIPDGTYVPTTEVGAANGVASLDGTGNVPQSQLGNVPKVNDATTSAPGLLEASDPPSGTHPVAVTTDNAAYKNAARTDQPTTFQGVLKAENGAISFGDESGTAAWVDSSGSASFAGTVKSNGNNVLTTATGVTSVNGQTGAVTVQGYNPLTSPYGRLHR